MEKPLVLRVEIESIGEELAALLAQAQPVAPVPGAEVREREAAVAAADAELRTRRDRLAEEAARLEALARRLAEREAAAETGGVTASQKLRLDRREEELDVREAEFEADVELREDRLVDQRAQLEELEQRLKRKESELLVYVAQLQEEFV